MNKGLTLVTDKNLLNVGELKMLNEAVGSRPRLEVKWIRALSFSPFVAFVVNSEDILLGFGRIEFDGENHLIYDMCVAPREHGKGIGSMIVDSLLAQARQAGVTLIGLSAWTPAARKFYLKQGFVDATTELELSNYMEIVL